MLHQSLHCHEVVVAEVDALDGRGLEDVPGQRPQLVVGQAHHAEAAQPRELTELEHLDAVPGQVQNLGRG